MEPPKDNLKMRFGLILLMFVLFCSVVSASSDFLGTFKIDEPITLIQTCSDCTFNNITTVTAPDGNIVLNEVAMTKTGTRYNYTLSAQSTIGTYNVCGVGDLAGDDTVWCYTFDVTYTGSTKESGLGVIILVQIIISAFYFWFGIFNHRKVKTDSTKVSTWLTILCYGMIIIKAITSSFIIYLYQTDGNVPSLLYILFYGDLFVLSGISAVTLIFAVVGYANPEINSGKWEPGKW